MTVWDILNQFTNLNFTLIVNDVVSGEELYCGDAVEVKYTDVGSLIVVSMEPPKHAYEVILNVEVGLETLYLEDDYTIEEELEWQNQIRA